MDSGSKRTIEDAGTAGLMAAERVVFVREERRSRDDNDVDLIGAWTILWRGKWMIIGITTLFAVLSVMYALSLTHWYRADALLAPAGESTTPAASQLGALVGVASLVGVSVGGGDVEALAVLQSRDFTRMFIQDQNLLPVLFADQWDEENGRWMTDDPEEQPDFREAVRFFDESIRTVEVGSGQMVTLSIEWPDPELAARWANLLVDRLNDYMRARALREAQANFDYLKTELAATSVVALQQSIGRLLENEMQRLMLARGNEEFAYRVIDRAEVPTIPSKPRRRLIAMLATLMGGVLSVFIVFVRHLISTYRSETRDGSSAARDKAAG